MTETQLKQYLKKAEFEEEVNSEEYNETTLYFTAPVELVKDQYPDAAFATISVSFATGHDEVKDTLVMVSPTKEIEDDEEGYFDYDWTTVLWPAECVEILFEKWDAMRVCRSDAFLVSMDGLLELAWKKEEDRLVFYDADHKYIDYLDTENMTDSEVAHISCEFLMACIQGDKFAARKLQEQFSDVIEVVTVGRNKQKLACLREQYGDEWVNRVGNIAIVMREY